MIHKYSDLQLKFNLPLDPEAEEAAERFISPEEARKISEAARLVLEGRSERQGEAKASWYKEYQGLIEQGWPWRVACYIAWASSPKIGREPKTLGELATKVLGLTGPRTIHKWREKYPTLDTVVAMMQAAPLWQHRRDVLEALAAMAAKEDYKSHNDRKLFLEMIGDYVPKSKIDLGKDAPQDLSDMSDAELAELEGKLRQMKAMSSEDEPDIDAEADVDG